MDAVHHPLVPEQYKGIKKDLAYTVMARDMDDAASWFLDVKDNLLQVNSWTGASETAISFALADKHKKVLHRHAHTNDLVQVHPDQYQVGDIWSYSLIDIVEYDYDPDTDYESIGMRLCLPTQDEEGITYQPDGPTITFVCDRRDMHLSATCHVRNLKEHSASTSDTWANVTDEQWQGLLKSFVAG